jgi:hypothetical protein
MGRRMDASEYRAKARELRDMARTTKDTTARADLLALADRYDWLAKHAEDDHKSKET